MRLSFLRPFALLPLLSALGLAGCGSPEAPSGDAPAPDTAAAEPMPTDSPGVDRSDEVPLQRLLQAQLRGDGGLVLAELPEPNATDSRAVENRHMPGQTDTIRTMDYGGLRIVTYDVATGGRLLQSVVLETTDYDTPEGVRIGMARDSVLAAYGEPDRREDGALVYGLSPEVPNEVRFDLQAGRVQRISWSFYVD